MLRKMCACALALALILCGVCAVAEGAQLSVRGGAMVNVPADRAYVNLGVRVTNGEVVQAQSLLNQNIQAVVEALKALGLPEVNITTDAISLYPNYNYEEEERVESYTAYTSIRARVDDMDQVGACIDTAFAAGANTLDYVEYVASDTEAASRKALHDAVESANEKAEVLAEASGMKLGSIISITESDDAQYNLPVMYKSGAAAEATEEDVVATQVYASQIQVSAGVVVVYELIPEN